MAEALALGFGGGFFKVAFTRMSAQNLAEVMVSVISQVLLSICPLKPQSFLETFLTISSTKIMETI